MLVHQMRVCAGPLLLVTAIMFISTPKGIGRPCADGQSYIRFVSGYSAIGLAASMDGLITDDNGQVIRAEALDVIGADLEQLYDTLEARDLAAGSLQARRLFS